jgi:ABC-type phosphate transport system substrate-binding protein
MRMLNRRAGIAAGALAVAGLTLASTGIASADSPAARSGDAVGVGSDTLQNLADFLFDGSPGAVDGYNAQGNINRVYSVFATGDANGRATYDGTCGAAGANGLGANCGGTNTGAPNLLPASVILRAGTKPVVRPNGSGAGVAALIADAPGDTTNFPGYEGLPNGSIQFARMSRLPNATEIGECPTSGACGGLHVYQAATDQLEIATSAIPGSVYEGPSGLSAQELVGIYQCTTTKWNALPGNTSGSSATIHPLIPQSGSGTRNFFLADLQAANGGTAITLGACVRTVEEHDPTGIYGDSAPQDAIEPFSAAKIALINGGYFSNGAGYKGTSGNNAYSTNQLKLLSGAPGDTNPVYNSKRGLYFVIRNPELADKTPAQPGGTLNWAQTLFAGTTAWIARAAEAPAIQAAGFTPAYEDCGVFTSATSTCP